MSETGLYYTLALYGSSTMVHLFSDTRMKAKMILKGCNSARLPNIPRVCLYWNHIKDTNFFVFKDLLFCCIVCHLSLEEG